MVCRRGSVLTLQNHSSLLVLKIIVLQPCSTERSFSLSETGQGHWPTAFQTGRLSVTVTQAVALGLEVSQVSVSVKDGQGREECERYLEALSSA